MSLEQLTQEQQKEILLAKIEATRESYIRLFAAWDGYMEAYHKATARLHGIEYHQPRREIGGRN
jgi:hypothetical protein